jgi:hypothetical protein
MIVSMQSVQDLRIGRRTVKEWQIVPVLQPLEADGALEELARQPLVAAHAADGGCSGGAVIAGAGRHHGLARDRFGRIQFGLDRLVYRRT